MSSDSDSDIEVISFDPDHSLDEPDPEEEEEQCGEWECLQSCMEEKEEEDEEFFDANQTMSANSLSDLTSSDLSMESDNISTDDEDIIEEYLIYKQARRQQKQSLRRLNRVEEQKFDERDEINLRYLIHRESPKKPCTMTSVSGQAALMNMKRMVMPAHEMLRNYILSSERNWMQHVKENVCLGKPLAVTDHHNSVRNVLSEKN